MATVMGVSPAVAIPSISAGLASALAIGFRAASACNLICAIARSRKPGPPRAVYDVFPANLPRTLLVNRTTPRFDNAELRRAMALSLDHQAFIDTITVGQGDVGGAMQPPPEGVNDHGWFWGVGSTGSSVDTMHFELADERSRRWSTPHSHRTS